VHQHNFDSLEEIRQILEEGEIIFVGAMGKKSKNLAEQDGIHLDVTSGVIDKSILMALCGESIALSLQLVIW